MISKKIRLPRSEFRARGYRSAATPFFSLKTKKNTLPINRIGVVVSKSVDKRATRRNFLKRQAKTELLRAPGSGLDVILTVFPKANALTKSAFQKKLSDILNSSS